MIRIPSNSFATRRKAGAPRGSSARRLVARHRAVEPPDQEVGAAVAIEIAELGDVLAVGEDRGAVHVLQRVGREYETVGAALPIVPVVLDVAERLLGEEIEIAVGVHVGEAVPLSHVDVAVLGAARDEAGQAVALAVALEESDAAGHFLQEQIEIAVTVGVHQLGTGGVEPAVERQLERTAGGVHHREGRDDGAIPEPALLGRRSRVRCPPAQRRDGQPDEGGAGMALAVTSVGQEHGSGGGAAGASRRHAQPRRIVPDAKDRVHAAALDADGDDRSGRGGLSAGVIVHAAGLVAVSRRTPASRRARARCRAAVRKPAMLGQHASPTSRACPPRRRGWH